MSDDRRTRAVALPGDPDGWQSTLRDLLEDRREDAAERAAVVRRLGEASPPTDEGDADADADEGVDFLDEIGILDASGGEVTPGPYGREFLETGEAAAIYDGLTAAVGGFETLLSSLVVRPLTDVEFMDLLSREFDADFESPDPIVAHRQWLEALGYVDHDGGVNELTRAGRRRVATDDDLQPPGANAAGRDAGTAGPSDGPESGGPGGSTPDATAAGTSHRTSDSTDPTDSADAADSTNPTGPADAAGGASDDDPFADLKRRYEHECMVCGDRRRRTPGAGHARVHHPMPIGDAHGGPVEAANTVVVCPNHRADFEFGLLTVDPRTNEIEHAYESAVSGRTLATAEGHDLGAQYLAYHNEVVARF